LKKSTTNHGRASVV